MAAGEKAQAEGAAPGLTIREAQRACEAAGVPFKHKKVCSTCNLYFPRTWYCAGCAWHGRDEAEWYCSTTCQKAHWRAGHKDSCRRLRISADGGGRLKSASLRISKEELRRRCCGFAGFG